MAFEFEEVNDVTYDDGYVLENEDGTGMDEDDDSDFYKQMTESFNFSDEDFDEENY